MARAHLAPWRNRIFRSRFIGRSWLALGWACALVAFETSISSRAAADAPHDDPARGAAELSAGAAALERRDLDEAGAHFEASDAAVPSVEALARAVDARVEQGESARAATLAELVVVRYPGTPAAAHARDVLAKLTPALGAASVACASPCRLAVNGKSLPGEPATRRTIYLEPGVASVEATFFQGAPVAHRVRVEAGRAGVERFEPEETSPLPAPLAPIASSPPPPEVPPTYEMRSPVGFAFGVTGAAVGTALLAYSIVALNDPSPCPRSNGAGTGIADASCDVVGTFAKFGPALLAILGGGLLLGGTAGATYSAWRVRKPPSGPSRPSLGVSRRGASLTWTF